jgi:pyridoxal 5'-phosphate synthase pdxT subunit
MGIWGTCAGAILLAKQASNLHPQGLQLMNITVERNAFGRQVESFMLDLDFPGIGDIPFPAVFIRAPIITKVGTKAKTLVKLDDGTIVAARQNKFLATSFHPELTNDNRIHKYFLQML